MAYDGKSMVNVFRQFMLVLKYLYKIKKTMITTSKSLKYEVGYSLEQIFPSRVCT